MKLKNKAQLESWLENGQNAEVINELKSQLKASKTGKELLPDVLNFAARLEKIVSDKISGVLSYDEETLNLNRLRKDLLVFIEGIENQRVATTNEAVSSSKKAEPPANSSGGGFSWWWLLLPIVAVAIWYFATSKPTLQPIIKICTMNQMANEHCCTDHLSRLTLLETKGAIYVTAVFEGLTGKDPDISGMVYWPNGDFFPTQQIKLTLDETLGHICYSGMIMPVHGIKWVPSKFTLKLQINGEAAGEKDFELIQ